MPTPTNDQWRWVIGGTVALILGLFICSTVLYSTADDTRDPLPLITLLIGLASTAVVALLALLKAGENTQTTKATARTVSELANGSMDAKIRAAVSEVLAPHLINPDALDTLAEDRLRVRELDDLAARLKDRAK